VCESGQGADRAILELGFVLLIVERFRLYIFCMRVVIFLFFMGCSIDGEFCCPRTFKSGSIDVYLNVCIQLYKMYTMSRSLAKWQPLLQNVIMSRPRRPIFLRISPKSKFPLFLISLVNVAIPIQPRMKSSGLRIITRPRPSHSLSHLLNRLQALANGE